MTDRAHPAIAAIILAAGQATRFRAADPAAVSKVVALLDGKPLVRHVAEVALASAARPVIVVTGHAHDEVRAALQDLPVQFVHNAEHAQGMATSLRAGLAAAGACDGLLVLLADMPRIDAALLDRLILAFAQTPAADAAVAIYDGRRGNPVLLCKTLFADVRRLAGDEGARRLLAGEGRRIVEIAGDASVTLDIDTPQALREAQDKN